MSSDLHRRRFASFLTSQTIPAGRAERRMPSARRQLVRVEQRIRCLEALRTELGRMIEDCSGGRVAECRVIEVLRDHSECLTDHRELEA